MAWVLLVLAGLLEIGWAVGLKATAGFTRVLPSLVTLSLMAGSVYLLALSVRSLPIGTAYAVWTGIGAIGTVVFGIVALGEPRHAARLFCLALVAIGIAGLKVTSPPDSPANPQGHRASSREE